MTDPCDRSPDMRILDSEVDYQYSVGCQALTTIVIESLRAQLSRLTVHVESVYEEHIRGVGGIAHKTGAILAEHSKALVIPRHAKQVPESHDVRIDFHREDRSCGYFGVAILRDGSLAQADHDNLFRSRFEEQKAHHRLGVGNDQLIRRVAGHLTLGRQIIEMKAEHAVPPACERPAARKVAANALTHRRSSADPRRPPRCCRARPR